MMPLRECSQTQHMPGHGPPRTILNDGATPGIVKLLHQSGCCHCFIPRSKYPDAQPCVLSLPQPVSRPPATPILHPDPSWPARKSVTGPHDSKEGSPQGLSQLGTI